jgi:hypothetical protein
MSVNMMIHSMDGQSIGNIVNKEKNKVSFQLNTGDRFFGEVIQSNDQEVKIGIETKGGSKEMLLQMKNGAQKFQPGDMIEIKVLESTKELLRVSIEKMDQAQEENIKNHDPNKDKVNVESTKKTFLQSDQTNSVNGSKQGTSGMTDFISQVKQLETSLSEKEYKALLQEGYDLTKMSVPMLNQFLQLHRKHTDGDFTSLNVDKISKFAEKVDKVQQMDPQDVVKFLLSNKPATISEMYKSLYSGGNQMPDYLMSEADYGAIKDSAHQIIDYVPTKNQDQLQAITKELVMRGGALDQRSLDVLSFLQRQHNGDHVMKMAAYQFEKNAKLEDYTVSDAKITDSIPSQELVKESLEDIKTITVEDIRRLLTHHLPITIENVKGQQSNHEVAPEETVSNEAVDQEIENLNVIRYQMTFKAAMRLSLKGINIRTASLGQLRAATQDLVSEYLSDTPVKTEAARESVQQSPKDVWASWQMSMATINGSSTQMITKSIEDTQTTINALLARASAGAERYDTLRTEVRPDLGDRIEKAFSNVTEILKDLGLEVSLYNQRAVQILGRNGMAMTIENIQQVKMIDVPLQEVQKKMMPEQVLAFLKEGKDIMNMPLTTLTQELMNRSKQTMTNPVDRMIKELHHLLKTEEVPEATKSAVVGVYRLMHTISSAHNAAVGFLLDRDLPVTLENLFEASKYIQETHNQSSKIEVSIDDSTGFLESIKQESPSIIEQIATGYYEKDKELQSFLEKPIISQANIEPILEDVRQQMQTMDYEKVQRLLDKLSTIHWSETGMQEDVIKDLTINEFQALEKIQKNPLVFKGLMEELVSTTASEDDNKQWLEPLFEAYMNDLDQTENHRQDIYKTLDKIKEDFFEKALDTMMNNRTSADGKRSLSEVTKDIEAHSRLEEKLVEQNNYHTIPVMINNQIQQMNVYYYEQQNRQNDAELSSSIYMRFTTEHMGSTNIRVQFSEKVEVTMFATLAKGNTKMQAYEEQIRNVFKELDLAIDGIAYDTFEFPQPVKTESEERVRSQQLRRYQESQFEKVI